jgi:quinoprotein glucose dehydrogenase
VYHPAVRAPGWLGWLALLPALAAGCAEAPDPPRRGAPASWTTSSGGPGGQRYSPLDEIRPSNVHRLERVWEFHTGDLPDADTGRRNHSFQTTPVLVDDTLVFCTPRSRVIAIDAETGELRWSHDPRVDVPHAPYNLNCRGVAVWLDRAAPRHARCRRRVFAAAADARLLALDAASGQRCPGFGVDGVVDFGRNVPRARPAEVGVSSPPLVVGDVVVVGSSVRENLRVDLPSGLVQAFDARSGARLWSWDPIPRDPRDPARASWQDGSADRTGAANVWSLTSADPERGLVFLPTSSPSPDWYGGERRGDNRNADSVVALRASSGELVWAFQTVHHDLWDYDVASQPVLLDLEHEGTTVPALAQATKMGNLFLLHRETGEPLVPVQERPVPQTDVPGEWSSPTQPFPTWPAPLVPQRLRPADAWGLTAWDRDWCRARIRALRSEGVFTPPSLEGTVVFPGTAGGSNWGSVAVDPERKLLFANTSRVANTVQLLRREEVDVAAEQARRDGARFLSLALMEGTPYVARFGVLVSPFGIPCNPPPWGALAALDLEARELRWEVTLGTTRDLAPLGIAMPWGTPGMGGPLATAGGLVFVGAALDDVLRAFDSETGEELWSGRLPAGGQATPMTYRVREGGRQFVVIAAGGHSQLRTTRGDSVVAFALPE